MKKLQLQDISLSVYRANLRSLVEHFNKVCAAREVKLLYDEDKYGCVKLSLQMGNITNECIQTPHGIWVIDVPDNEFESDVGYILNPYTRKLLMIELSEYSKLNFASIKPDRYRPSDFFQQLNKTQIIATVGSFILTILGAITFNVTPDGFTFSFSSIRTNDLTQTIGSNED